MVDLNTLNIYRDDSSEVIRHFGHKGDSTCGRFFVRIGDELICVIAAAGEGWDHISVSCKERCATWAEMEHIKRMFFKPNEVAFQLHVPPKDHINNNPNVLHIWRPHHKPIPLPPKWMV